MSQLATKNQKLITCSVDNRVRFGYSSFIITQQAMADVTDATFDEEVLKSDIPVLVDFWAPWCGPCKSMLPIVEEVAKAYEGKVKVVKVNVDENSEKPQQFSVMSIPSFFIFKDGEVAHSFVGVKTKEFMSGELDKVLAA